MMTTLLANTISPHEEMVSYEVLWGMPSRTRKSMADMFHEFRGLPSRVLESYARTNLFDALAPLRAQVEEFLSSIRGFSVSVNGAFQYPKRLQEARYPFELFYYRGDIGLIESRCVSVVGARKASLDGLRRAAKLARGLAASGFTIVSGLAAGIDTAAMTATIEAGGSTVGVIGTPITESYPRENIELQEKVAREHLLLSHVPFYRYNHDPFPCRKYYFPQRNELMACLSEATIIVEASDTSGSLTQARACMQQGRKLFILNSCFENPSLTWPATYEKRGAIRVRDLQDILNHLSSETQEL